MYKTLAWENLLHRKGRTLAIIAGVSFPTLLLFLQLGFYSGAVNTATLVLDRLQGDIFLTSKVYTNLSKSGQFPRSRLYQAMSVPGVQDIAPVSVGVGLWRNPNTRQHRQILVLGFDPALETFRLPELNPHYSELAQADTVAIDRLNRPDLGPQKQGTVTEIAGRRVRIVAHYSMGTGFAQPGGLIVSQLNFSRLFPGRSPERITLGLLRISPGMDQDQLAARLSRKLPGDTEVWTRERMERREEAYWIQNTSIGKIFGIGTGVAFLVGFLILYQALSSDTADRLSEYATLKAIGYAPKYLAFVVLQQALTLTTIAYIPAFLFSLVFYALTREFANLPVEMTLGRAVLVFGLTVVMGSTSVLLSLRKLQAADPAELF